MVCRYSTVYGPARFTLDEARKVMAVARENLDREDAWQPVQIAVKNSATASETTSRLKEELISHVKQETKNFDDAVSKLQYLKERNQDFEAEHYATGFVDSVLTVYNSLRTRRSDFRKLFIPSSATQ